MTDRLRRITLAFQITAAIMITITGIHALGQQSYFWSSIDFLLAVVNGLFAMQNYRELTKSV